MKKLLIAFLLILGTVDVFGQDANQNEKTILRIYCGPTKTDPAKSPMTVINGKYIIYQIDELDAHLNINDIKSITIPKDIDSLTQLYGEKAKNGIISLELKEKVDIIEIDELFDSFNIKEKYRSLPLYVNDKLIIDKSGFFISSVMIRKVKVVNRPTDGVPDIEFISIKTKP